MEIRKHIPNLFTLGNLLCGCIGTIEALHGNLINAAWLIWAAAVFDFLDGFLARLLRTHSEIGKQLDSLADMITFGVLPSMIMFEMLNQVSGILWLPYFAFLIALFSALRLAKFNIDENQSNSFIGLPTPANALFISSFPFFVFKENFFLGELIDLQWLLLIITVVFSYLMVANIEMIALKFKNFSWADNKIKFVLIGLSILLIAGLKISGIPIIIILYVSLSGISNRFFVRN
ncbi:CDP-diacylglycerol--serine O-phosphatidyltransferase [Fulvivirgaceae bacterium BMA10]|uniref:CDP-diacylglycerol--serine O-phosphatidyltransferase n=1 Tax=Splendidivirga corallicola TaxID=3051826 RepID=A0ABT8KLE1_9BACT|nr:CDP-diacylglycerol--serine O-phosphatidyltransferase [Fulvivirgaceae bacterium BMA10]